MRKIKVLFVTQVDWANVGSNYCKALESINIDSKLFVTKIKHYEKTTCARVFTSEKEILPYVKNADIIHFLHSKNPIKNINLKGKKVVVSHTGSNYRNFPKKLNKLFNPIVDLSIVGSGLYGKGAKNEKWIPGGVVDTNVLKPIYKRKSDKIIIGHFHPSFKTKGSKNILYVMKTIKGNFEFRYSFKLVSWEQQMKRVSKCDVYIERFKKNTGFGIAAIEAAALGKIVITTNAFKNKYEETTGSFDLISVKTIPELKEKIEEIIEMPDNEILELKKKSRLWAVKYHSYEPVGNRLLNLYKEIL